MIESLVMAPLAGRRALRGRALRGLAEDRRGLCRAQPVTGHTGRAAKLGKPSALPI